MCKQVSVSFNCPYSFKVDTEESNPEPINCSNGWKILLPIVFAKIPWKMGLMYYIQLIEPFSPQAKHLAGELWYRAAVLTHRRSIGRPRRHAHWWRWGHIWRKWSSLSRSWGSRRWRHHARRSRRRHGHLWHTCGTESDPISTLICSCRKSLLVFIAMIFLLFTCFQFKFNLTDPIKTLHRSLDWQPRKKAYLHVWNAAD